MCRCIDYIVFWWRDTWIFWEKINLINNCECCWGTPGARRGCLVATSDLSRGYTEGRGTCVHTLFTIQWQHCQHQSGSFCLYFICNILHSILNSSTFVSYLLSTAQLTMLLWQLDNLCGNQPNIFLILIKIRNIFEISNPKQELLIISSLSSFLKVCLLHLLHFG